MNIVIIRHWWQPPYISNQTYKIQFPAAHLWPLWCFFLQMPSPQKRRGGFGRRSVGCWERLWSFFRTCSHTAEPVKPSDRPVHPEMTHSCCFLWHNFCLYPLYWMHSCFFTVSMHLSSPQAIQHPSDERVQEQAWAAVVPLVGKLKKFYEFSLKLGMSFFPPFFNMHCTQKL